MTRRLSHRNLDYKRLGRQSPSLFASGTVTHLFRRFRVPIIFVSGILLSTTLLVVALDGSLLDTQSNDSFQSIANYEPQSSEWSEKTSQATEVDNRFDFSTELSATEAAAQTPLSFTYGHRPSSIRIPSLIATLEPHELPWQPIIIQSGDTLSGLFSRLELSLNSLRQILALGGDTEKLTKLRAGKTIELAWIDNDEGKDLLGIRLQHSESYTLEVVNKGDYFAQYSLHHPPEIREVFAQGTIKNSLSVDAAEAGVPMSIVMKMADIFAWDIDFALDIRKGDTFAVVYEEVWANGERIRTGQVLATQFENRGRTKEAVYFEDEDGYSGHFTPEGNSLRKAFLRSPLKFNRISSRFSMGRKHPILNKIRAHKGVDYAAKRGTPINAAGDGKVKFAGWKTGYGRTLIIQHRGGIETLYAHLHAFADGVKVGQRVNQGQRVAYVGSTGLATGPHLHYEFRQNGQHKDPLKVTLPRSVPLPDEYAADFNIASKRLMARINQLGGQQSMQESSAPITD